jgi:hypothetical protein
MNLLNYPEVKRIPVEGIPRVGKDYLTEDEVELLLGSGRKVVQEKVDGKSEWEMVKRAQVFYEFCKFRHSIPYTHLPSWKIALDVWDTVNDRWADPVVYRFLETRYGWSFAPTLIETLFTIDLDDVPLLLRSHSAYNLDHMIEGIVVKNYDIPLFGKIVNPEFEDLVTAGIHPQKRRIQEMNRLA